MRLGPDSVSNLLNIQYGVCFSVVFSSLFYFSRDSSKGEYETFLKLDGSNLVIAILLIVYFFLDWIFANFYHSTRIRIDRFADLSRLVAISVWVWLLGALVITAISGITTTSYSIFIIYVIGTVLFQFSLFFIENNYKGTFYKLLYFFAVAFQLLMIFVCAFLLVAHYAFDVPYFDTTLFQVMCGLLLISKLTRIFSYRAAESG